jgi:glutaredoxin
MDTYKKPSITDYTIYSISNCKYCVMAKDNINKLKAQKCTTINCDKFIMTCRERDKFYNFIKQYTIIPYFHFPMIFKNGKFVGGLKELLVHNQKPLEKAKKPVKKKTKYLNTRYN